MGAVMDFEKMMFEEAGATESAVAELYAHNKGKKAPALLNALTQKMYECTSAKWKDIENMLWQYYWTGF